MSLADAIQVSAARPNTRSWVVGPGGPLAGKVAPVMAIASIHAPEPSTSGTKGLFRDTRHHHAANIAQLLYNIVSAAVGVRVGRWGRKP
jgi:hypothetical protein